MELPAQLAERQTRYRLGKQAATASRAADAFALLIDDIRPPDASSARTLAEAFRFTPAEARLVAGLLSGENLKETAQA